MACGSHGEVREEIVSADDVVERELRINEIVGKAIEASERVLLDETKGDALLLDLATLELVTRYIERVGTTLSSARLRLDFEAGRKT